MALSDELSWRGFVNQMTFQNLADVNEPRTFYWGVDPSADSMHIGNLAPAMMIRHFLDHGHKAILLVGGATGMIGDPDGKKQERDLLTKEEIERNKAAIVDQYKAIFAGKDFEIVDNYDWFKDINYLEFLRDIGKHAPMTQMLDRDFIKTRIGEGGDGISYAEFSYALIQGYDFLHLYRQKQATMQLSGADQWGNCITGVQLIRRLEKGEAHVFTTPLIINKQTGNKFGKTEAGAVWLDPKKTSPYQFYQFWLNVDDATAEDLVKIYTLLDKATVEQLVADHRTVPEKRTLQTRLAYEVTVLVHGENQARLVQKATDALFSDRVLAEMGTAILDILAGELPVVAPMNVVPALVESGVATSNGEARRLIAGGAISVNGEKVMDDQVLTAPSLIKKGKNNFVLVR